MAEGKGPSRAAKGVGTVGQKALREHAIKAILNGAKPSKGYWEGVRDAICALNAGKTGFENGKPTTDLKTLATDLEKDAKAAKEKARKKKEKEKRDAAAAKKADAARKAHGDNTPTAESRKDYAAPKGKASKPGKGKAKAKAGK